MKNLNNQNGRSMIEMLGVLAIIGVLSVGGIAGYSKAMMKYRINKTIEQITLIAGNIRAFWGPQKNYTGVYCSCYDGSCKGQSDNEGCPIIKKAKIFPDEMVTLDSNGKITSITNVFGGIVETRGAGVLYLTDEAFALELTRIPEEACIELLSQDWSTAGVTVICNLSKPKCILQPASVDEAISTCSDGAQLRFMFDYKESDYDEDVKYLLNL